ncbi:outer membrane protein assembly factor BamB family protein [Gemmata sp.]|uniref:outer membrane protein assembly factor BamB family protein n=1 Tax=Gemmata sp. TaxID=1914242 RepID=UPI003F721FD6
MHPYRLFLLPLFALLSAPLVSAAGAADWVHWRGPEQNGHSKETGLPAEFDPRQKEKGNVAWTQPFGGRSAPLVMDGRLYIIQGTGEGLGEAEQVVCFDEKTGKKLWEYRVSVYHTDIVSSRLGWTTLAADPATGHVYAHTTAGALLCLDRAGKLVWTRHLTEEFGRVTGYGGRIVSPVFDSGLVIIGMVNGSWGDLARGLNRFVAFDAKTGEVVWWSTLSPDTLYGTYYSIPVVAVIGGQRLLLTGGADGSVHALKVRTGEVVWSKQLAKGVINGSPVVSGNLVYFSHGEENPEGAPIGRIVCLDASQIDPATKDPKVVWDTFRRKYKANRNRELANRFGLASAALADGLLYVPDDTGELFCFRAKDGEMLWKSRYATEVRGAPLVADGKLYVFDVKGRMLIYKLNGEKAPDPDETFEYKFPAKDGLPTETNCTPIAVNGRVYFTTRTDLYALADAGAKAGAGKYEAGPEEAPLKEGAVAGVRLFPADASAKPGEKVTFRAVFFDANGREVKHDAKGEWSLPVPPLPKGATTPPPALQGTIADGVLALAPVPSQQGYVDFQAGGLKARARVRVVPQIPYAQNFDKLPPGAAPGGWVNVQGKYLAKKLDDGSLVLSKANTDARPPLARANGYITSPEATDYTVQADMQGTKVRDRMPDMGLVNCRYTLVLDGKPDPATGKRTLRLTSWDARPRIGHEVPFDWQPGEWYTVKFTVEQTEKTAELKAKVWKRGEAEPAEWTATFSDPSPNRAGAAALYGYVTNVTDAEPGSDIYYDNVTVTPNKAPAKAPNK